MTDAEIDNLWLEAFKASSDDGRVRQRFAELCYRRGAAEMKERCAVRCQFLWIIDGSHTAKEFATAIREMN